jgi:hypothetical protein
MEARGTPIAGYWLAGSFDHDAGVVLGVTAAGT